jgi:DHA1 family bicyclomycin/chloramphenicol resistance-like MFS transporter
MSVIAFGNGFLFPIGSAAALSAVPRELSGTAAGFMGCLQFLLAALCSSCIGNWGQGQAMHLAVFIGIIVLAGLCSTFFLLYKPNRRTIVQEWV